MAIIQPENMRFDDKHIFMILSGAPGTGKTTLALSAPDPLLIDCDQGIVRVDPAHRKATADAKLYEDVLADIRSIKDGLYKTIILDTCGALIELMKDWAMRTEPAASKKSGGFSQQGYGIIKSEFLRFSAELRKRFNVIYVFHASRERTDDGEFYDIICEGSTKTIVWQPADLGAYLHIINGERMLGFSPTMLYNAKSAYGIKGLVKVPELEKGDPNDFLTKLFARIHENIESENEQGASERETYERVMAEGAEIIGKVENPEDMEGAATAIKALEKSLTSEKELKARLTARMKEKGIAWDKERKAYVRAGE